MALQDILKSNLSKKKQEQVFEITKDNIKKDLSRYQYLISYWRVYPDKFIDYLASLNPDNNFHFFPYQRIILRAMMRFKTCYCVFPRAYSKSFLAVACMLCRCILYPGIKIFTASGVKEQSASILTEKLKEWCKLVPAFEKEIIWDNRGSTAAAKTRQTKDNVVLAFKNGSSFENVPASETTRGRRFNAGLKIAQDKFFELLKTLSNSYTTILCSYSQNECLTNNCLG